MDATRHMKKGYERIALENKSHHLVGLDPQMFIENFLPWNGTTLYAYTGRRPQNQRLKDLRSIVPERRQKASLMYRPFVKALEWVTKGRVDKGQLFKAADFPLSKHRPTRYLLQQPLPRYFYLLERRPNRTVPTSLANRLIKNPNLTLATMHSSMSQTRGPRSAD
ncbi:hypothetical protein BYT27DRAFT_6553456 [Phlegmacium glaucopus]|nr:hypothetical protein BYT27DRAFT_6553456 [Phlegmacium glaucopus]